MLFLPEFSSSISKIGNNGGREQSVFGSSSPSSSAYSVTPSQKRLSTKPPQTTEKNINEMNSSTNNVRSSSNDPMIQIPRAILLKLVANPSCQKSTAALKTFLEHHQPEALLKTTECSCRCTCGFYPANTRLQPPPLAAGAASAESLTMSSCANSDKSQSYGPFETNTHQPMQHVETVGMESIRQIGLQSQPSNDNDNFAMYSSSFTKLNSAYSSSGCPMANMGWIPPDLADLEPSGELSIGELNSICNSMIDAAIASEFTEPASSEHHAAAASITNETRIAQSAPSSPVGCGFGAQNDVLTPREHRKLDELVAANEIMKQYMELKYSKETRSLTDVVNMTDIAIRRLIQMCKRIAGFRSLSQEDQIALLKGSCTELMILRGIMNYDPEKDAWLGPNSREFILKCDVFKGIKGGNVYEEHKKYLNSFQPSWRKDEPIMLLLGVIVLFSPTRQKVKNTELIKQQQQMYYSLLKRYLHSVMGGPEANETFGQLVRRIAHLHSLNEAIQNIFLNVNPQDVEPLIIEIFDLK